MPVASVVSAIWRVDSSARAVKINSASFVADFREPEFDRLGLWARNTLDETQQGLGSGDVSEVAFAVGGRQFQLVTICNQLASFLAESVFQNLPVVSGGLEIRLLGENLDDVHDGEKPGFGLLVVEAADFALLEDGRDDFHGEWGSGKQLAVQRAVLDRLQNVGGADVR
jgi:hypothetical protein